MTNDYSSARFSSHEALSQMLDREGLLHGRFCRDVEDMKKDMYISVQMTYVTEC